MNDEQLQNQVEDPSELGQGQEGERKRWLTEIMLSGKNDKEWRRRANAVIKRYRDERNAVEKIETKMNILWSNTQTIIPALYANTPKPLCDRRNKQKDPVGLMAARILEGALEYSLDNDDFDSVMRDVVEDFQLPGRATARVFYRPEMTKKRLDAKPLSYATDYQPNYDDPDNPFEVQGDPVYAEGTQFDDDGAYTMDEVVDFEEVDIKYVHWKDFRIGKALSWKSVPWAAFRSYLTKQEATDRFGTDIANEINYRHRPDEEEYLQSIDDDVELLMKCEIWEIWDKVDKKVIWVSKDYKDKLLDKSDPHLKLKGFYPCPEPLIMTRTTGSMQPVPEFLQYQDQATEIDELSNRISILVQAIRLAGVYDQNCNGLENILTMDNVENKLYPIANWAQFMDKGGLEAAIAWLPIEQMIAVVTKLYEAREVAIQKIYEITGIADIIRGSSDARETAAAQQIKGRFASMRLRDKQKKIANFARDLIRLTGEVIADNFGKETLQAMTGIRYEKEKQSQPEQQQPMQQPKMPSPGQPPMMPGQQMMPPPQPSPEQQEEQDNEQMWDQVLELFKNDPLRQFRIAIETDSTIQPDEEAEKKSRIEFLRATGDFMKGAIELIGASSDLTPLVTELLMFGVRGFRTGKEMEDRFQDTMDQINAKAMQQQQNPPQPPPDPRAIEAQAKAKVLQDESSQKLSIQKQESDQKLMIGQKKAEQEAEQSAKKHRAEMFKLGLDYDHKRECNSKESAMLDAKHACDRLKFADKARADHEAREAKSADSEN